MSRKESDSAREKRIESEASQWMARKYSGFTPSDQDDFFEWMAADPTHSEAFVKYQDLWNRMDSLAEWAPEHSETPHRDLLKSRQSVYRHIWWSGIAAVLAIGAILWASGLLNYGATDRQNYVANAYEAHDLSDGSVVEMKTGSALKVNFTPVERRVELVASEALFSVAKDVERPFIVSAKGVVIQAIGTAFNVRVAEDEVEVLVTEGKVSLDTALLVLDDDEIEDTARSLVHSLEAGQRFAISLGGENATPVIEYTGENEILEKLDWRYRLDFDSTPLGEAVDQINRRSDIEMIIVDQELSELPIVATLRTYKLDHFVELLEISFGIESEEDSRGRILLKAGSGLSGEL